ncbi:MAG: DUF2243 domain-containing protein [Chroococcidiopsidaceae cyanobacterium CP_BM_ER_R8_30]|nr:DUF2243 domain-containing protein [Chroococcidiopsidaceae cyanobacterium CP_BM_ER_R8_30]
MTAPKDAVSNTTSSRKFSTNSVDGRYRPLVVAGLVLGIGQAGFFDGIVFHQLLQWHHMFSSVKTDATVAGMELNTIGDGLFHVFDWLMTLLGIFLLWQAGKRQDVIWSTSAFVGSLLIGGGIFNLVEGLIDHQILGIHHVKPGPNVVAYDIGFLAVGALMVVVGWVLLSGVRQSQPDDSK